MNRQMRRHPVHPALPILPTSKKSVIDTERQKTYVALKQQRKGRRKV